MATQGSVSVDFTTYEIKVVGKYFHAKDYEAAAMDEVHRIFVEELKPQLKRRHNEIQFLDAGLKRIN